MEVVSQNIVPIVATITVATVGVGVYVYLKKNQSNKRNTPKEFFDVEKLKLEEIFSRCYRCLAKRNYEDLENLIKAVLSKTEFTIDQLNFFDESSGGLLSVAARLGSTACVKVLLDYGANIHTADYNNETALHLSAKNGQLEVVQILLAGKSDPNFKNKNGWTPLHWSCTNGRTNITKLLLDSKADPNIKSGNNGRIPLHCAVQNGHDKDCRLLVEYNSLIDPPDNDGNTPILAVSKNGSIPILKLLLEHGGNLYDKNNDGKSLIQIAGCRGLSEFVLEILSLDKEGILLKELVEVIGVLQPINPNSPDFTDIHHKLHYVLQKIVSSKIYLPALLGLFVNQILQSCLKYLFAPPPSPESLEEFYSSLHSSILSSSTQLCWLIEFITSSENEKSEKKNKEKVISKALEALEELWGNIQAIFNDKQKKLEEKYGKANLDDSEFREKINKKELNDDKLMIRTCKMIGIYYNLHFAFSSSSPIRTSLVYDKFSTFIANFEVLLYFLIYRSPSLLFASLEFFLFFPKCHSKYWELVNLLGFEERRQWFLRRIGELKEKYSGEGLNLEISRESNFRESCEYIMIQGTDTEENEPEQGANPNNKIYLGKLNIVFKDENASGAGVRREWFHLLSKELFDPNNGLFSLCFDGTVQPSHLSSINPDHLVYFRFIGRFIALAVYHQELLEVHFTRSFYKHLLRIPVTYEDFEATDPVLFKNLQNLLEIEDVESLGLYFSYESQEFGKYTVIDLIENGRNVPVTDENKKLYCQLITELKMTKAIQQQINYFLEGFYDVIPFHLISIFNEFQLELLLSGVPSIDAEDWKKNTILNGYDETSPTILWFWEIVFEFDQNKRATLLQFATGTSRIPIGGFANLPGFEGPTKFTILHSPNTALLPTASTCFNLLKLPAYESKEILREKLEFALAQASGFGMA